MMEKLPEDRFQTPQELVEAIELTRKNKLPPYIPYSLRKSAKESDKKETNLSKRNSKKKKSTPVSSSQNPKTVRLSKKGKEYRKNKKRKQELIPVWILLFLIMVLIFLFMLSGS